MTVKLRTKSEKHSGETENIMFWSDTLRLRFAKILKAVASQQGEITPIRGLLLEL